MRHSNKIVTLLIWLVSCTSLLAQTIGDTPGSSGGGGTVTSVSVTTANGVSGTVANPTTTPAISLSLGAITPSSVAIGAGSAITSSGPGGTLGSNAFTSTAYAPIASPTFTGTVTMPDASTWGANGISGPSNILSLVNGATAQREDIYATSTSSNVNFQRLRLDSSKTTANMSTVAADNGGTGVAMGLQFGVALTTGGGITNIANFSTAGMLLWNTDNTYDIGASGVTRPRTGYFAANVIVGANSSIMNNSGFQVAATNFFYWTGRGAMQSPADGIIELTNTAITDFSRLQFGGTTSSFPALKRSTTTLAVRLADDSADAPLTASNITASGQLNVTAMTQTSVAQSGTVCYNSGTGAVTYDATLGCLTSTMREKDNWHDIPDDEALAKVVKMIPGSYTYRPGRGLPSGEQIGIAAEQMEGVDARLVAYDDKGQVRGTRYQQASALYPAAIRKLQSEIEELKAANDNLRARLDRRVAN